MIKCYHKEFQYVIPKLTCNVCGVHLKTGDGLYSVSLKWGRSISTCKKCYDKFEIDWTMHEDEYDG